MSNWRKYRLGDIGSVITGKTPSSKNPEQWGNRMPFVTPTDFDLYNKNIFHSVRYVSNNGVKVFQNKVLPINSIIVTCIGSQMGRVAINRTECVTNQQINSIIPQKKFNPDYIYYVLSSMQAYLRNLATGGSTMPIINKSAFEDITINIPPLPIQTAIAEILSSLDDKIELNNAINKNLEEIAKTLFKRWFVDFEFPDENGQPYKSSGGEMVKSELGIIPKGWRVNRLEDTCDVKLGGTPARSNDGYWNGTIPWVNSGEINKNYITKGVEYITKKGLKQSATKLIPSKSTLIAITGATLGQVSYSFINACYNQSVVSITANDPHKEYYHCFIIHHIADIVKNQTGGAQQHINKGDVEKTMIYVPSDNLIDLFHENAKEVFNIIEGNLLEEHSLNQLRNTLLPKLISGELEVSNQVK